MRHFHADIRAGNMKVNKPLVNNMLKHTPDGSYLVVLISLETDKDEREWQKYYRVLLKQMAEDTGNGADEMHEHAKAEVLSQMKLDSTTQLDPESWREYIERLGLWALDNFGFVIP